MSEPDREGAVRRVGRPGELVQRSVFQAADAIKPYIADLVNRIEAVGLDRALDEWEQAHKEDLSLSDMITRPMLMAEMGGQLMAAVYESKTVKLVRPHQLWLFQAAQPQAFMDLPFTEAIELYKSLNIPRNKEFLKVIEQYNSRSSEARALMLKYIRDKSKEKIVQAMEEGRDLRQYIADFQGFLTDLGLAKENPSYLQNVFNTNVASAYGAGRYRQLTDPDVLEELPYVQYRTVGDARVRESHRVLDGLIFRADDPAFASIYPPNGYRCRCSIVAYEPKPGEKIATAVPSEYVADPAFHQPPVTLISSPIS